MIRVLHRVSTVFHPAPSSAVLKLPIVLDKFQDPILQKLVGEKSAVPPKLFYLNQHLELSTTTPADYLQRHYLPPKGEHIPAVVIEGSGNTDL